MTAHLMALMIGCNTITGSDSADDVDVGDGGPTTDTSGETDLPAERPLAGFIKINKVSVFQGVESVQFQNGGAPSTTQMPLIIDRPGLMRVFVDPKPAFEERRVTGVLTITTVDEEVALETTLRVTEQSTLGNLDSTIDFELPPTMMKRTTRFALKIVELDVEGPGGGEADEVTWNSADTGGLDMQLTDKLTIALVPIRYNADGSGRLPDTGPAQVQRIKDLTMGMYPASEVTVRVDPPLDWPQRISPGDSGDWTDVLNTLVYLRAEANEDPNTYYYGMFNPEPSINDFCRFGCILGLSYLAYQPEEFFRASIGIGYTGDIASETLVHEVGHAHGREHAPCGLGPQGSDPQYPYQGASIGTWGYDVVTGETFPPTETVDMMSYCPSIWVSDYTFFALYDRMQEVSTQARPVAPVPRTALQLHADGRTTMRDPIRLASTDRAPRVEVELFDASGAPAGRSTAALFPYDHAPGGLVALDEELPPGWTASVVP